MDGLILEASQFEYCQCFDNLSHVLLLSHKLYLNDREMEIARTQLKKNVDIKRDQVLYVFFGPHEVAVLFVSHDDSKINHLRDQHAKKPVRSLEVRPAINSLYFPFIRLHGEYRHILFLRKVWTEHEREVVKAFLETIYSIPVSKQDWSRDSIGELKWNAASSLETVPCYGGIDATEMHRLAVKNGYIPSEEDERAMCMFELPESLGIVVLFKTFSSAFSRWNSIERINSVAMNPECRCIRQ